MGTKELNEQLLKSLEKNSNKRDNKIEKIQLGIIKNAILELSEKYKGSVVFDLSCWNTRTKANDWFISYDGEIKSKHCSEYNKWYDSKTFDAYVESTVNGKTFDLFFILKGVSNAGGHQDDVMKEIGGYSKAIQKNTNDNYHFFFVLDGDYINKEVNRLDKCDKYEIATSYTICEVIESFLTKNIK